MERAGAAGHLDRCGELMPQVVEEFEQFQSTVELAGWTKLDSRMTSDDRT
jgi:hypothetical protein